MSRVKRAKLQLTEKFFEDTNYYLKLLDMKYHPNRSLAFAVGKIVGREEKKHGKYLREHQRM